jgi:CSLREA domain-containing protein
VQAGSAPGGFGGGLHNVSSLALIRTRVTGGSAFAGGGIDSPVGSVSLRDARIDTNAATNGAGISTGGALTLTGTTLDANIALAQAGGIDVLGGILTATNSTLSGNRAGTLGGGLSVATGEVRLDSVTFGANSAEVGANAITSSVAIELRSVLIDSSGGSAPESCLGPIDSLGHNRADDGSCGLDQPSDLPPGSGDLGPLGHNGGPMPTHALLAGSAAIDAGDDATCPAADQRGIARRFGSSGISSCDIGAFEVEVVPLAVNSTADAADTLPGDGLCQTATPGECTLRAAISEANAHPGVDLIRLGAGVHGLSDPLGALGISDRVLIEGAGASATRIEGAWPVDPQPLLILAASAGPSELARLMLANGRGTSGAGRVSAACALKLEAVELHECAGGNRGAVDSSADLVVQNSAFIGNAAAQRGGGIHQSGTTLEITNSTFAGNSAAAGGGALALAAGSASVLNPTFADNTAPVRSTSLWQRSAHMHLRLRQLVETAEPGRLDPTALGEVTQLVYAFRARSRATQHRMAGGEELGPETSIDKVLLATAEQALFDLAAEALPAAIGIRRDPWSERWRKEFLYSRAATIYGGSAEIQRNIIARRLLDLGNDR